MARFAQSAIANTPEISDKKYMHVQLLDTVWSESHFFLRSPTILTDCNVNTEPEI